MKSKWLALSLSLLGMTACQPDPEAQRTDEVREYVNSLSFEGIPFDLLVEDIDEDGLHDLTVVDHGGNTGRTYFQTQPRHYLPGPDVKEVGFHPGNLILWGNKPKTLVMSAEGSNAVVALEPKSTEKGFFEREYKPLRGGFRVRSVLLDRAPRYAKAFDWPTWGKSLALTPFHRDGVILLKTYDASLGKAKERIVIRTGEASPSIKHANRIHIADINGDKVDDLLYATNITEQVYAIEYKAEQGDLKPRLLAQADEVGRWGMPNEAHPYDWDGDGDMDLIVPDETQPGKIHILTNDGKGVFAGGIDLGFPRVTSEQSDGVLELAIGRDKDGRDYLLAAGFTKLVIYQLQGGDTNVEALETRVIEKPRENTSVMRLVDIDQDGWLDLILGRTMGKRNITILYGPLWDHFGALEKEKFVLESRE